jgi:glycosyltransferase involved in cell wall biosynthesis
VVLAVGGVPTAEKNYGYKEELKALCKKMRIEDKVIFTGHREDVFRFFKLMDIVVHCAIMPDPQPGVVIQALAFGKPMIASRCGGVPEIVEEGKSALLVEPGNVSQLRDAILDLYGNPEKRKFLSENARLRFMHKFNLEKEMKKIETLYRMLTSRRR